MKITFKDKILSLSEPAVMGILNVTPDSFFDGGKHTTKDSMLSHAEKMMSEGADILDIGACSTRPNAPDVSEEEELKRLLPAIRFVRAKLPNSIISADTFRSNVAEQAVQEGADMINDISGGTFDQKMMETVAYLRVPYILMHIQGTPKTMQKDPQYKNVTEEVMKYFTNGIHKAISKGIQQIIIDPGFGFGKTLEHNYELLKNISHFKKLGVPILAGMSRKSMVNKVLGIQPEDALNGTTVANTIALMNGANILRVHDVKEAKEIVKIYKFLTSKFKTDFTGKIV